MVAAITVPGERTTAPLHVTRRDVIEYQRTIDEMLIRQRCLDAWLLLDEPVERLVYLALSDLGAAHRQCEARCCRLGRKRSVEGELRSRRNNPLNDHSFNQAAHAALHLRAPLRRPTQSKLAH